MYTGLVLLVIALILLFSLFREPIVTLLKYLMIKVFYKNMIVSFFRARVVQILFTSVAGSYYLILDVWGDSWPIVVEHKSSHELAFTVLLILTLIAVIIKESSEYIEEKILRVSDDISNSMSALTTRAVVVKLNRFKENSAALRISADIFNTITQPKEQINLILGEIESLIHKCFDIKKSQSCITIMCVEDDKQYFKYTTKRDWEHTRPKKLISGKSAAKLSLTLGEPVFFPSKTKEAKKGNYFLSDRDKKKGDGSVYCYPVKTNVNGKFDTYVISIVTYGKNICQPFDNDKTEAITEIFSDICRRIDLELTLESINNTLLAQYKGQRNVKFEAVFETTLLENVSRQ
jgi:hypothetical protein